MCKVQMLRALVEQRLTAAAEEIFTREPQSALNSLKHDLKHKKTFSCSECGKRFGTRRHLFDHMRIHPGEKKYSCSVCNKRFIWRQQVRRHKCVNLQSSQLYLSQTEENREAEPPASRETQHMETEADGEDCGGPEPARNSHPPALSVGGDLSASTIY
ncbi:zinc finger protein 467-like [Perca flavescens]|uniref:zinc finger protein 467-like n=1 Tax=Perca flavescens TaxID=8167 RepID=UPI00106E73BC|nr:zinc finger protein 467-like [Perca flavescens]